MRHEDDRVRRWPHGQLGQGASRSSLEQPANAMHMNWNGYEPNGPSRAARTTEPWTEPAYSRLGDLLSLLGHH